MFHRKKLLSYALVCAAVAFLFVPTIRVAADSEQAHRASGEARAKANGLTVEAQLFDGNKVIGATKLQSLDFDLGFQNLRVPISHIRRADVNRSSELMTIYLNNRDRITGALQTGEIDLKTSFGPVSLRTASIKSLVVHNPKKSFAYDDGLILHFSFDDYEYPGANVVEDKYHLDLSGDVFRENHLRGGYLSFNRNSHMRIPHDDALCPKKFSLSVWVKPSGNRSGYEFLVGKTNGQGSWISGYAFVNMSGDPRNLYFYVNNYSSETTKVPVLSGKWAHLVGVCDGQSVKLYKNGELVDSRLLSSQVSHSPQDFMVGGDRESYRWTGDMDEVMLFDRALDAEEVKDLFESQRQD